MIAQWVLGMYVWYMCRVPKSSGTETGKTVALSWSDPLLLLTSLTSRKEPLRQTYVAHTSVVLSKQQSHDKGQSVTAQHTVQHSF